MGRLIVLLIATMTVWGSVAFMYVASSPDWLITVILGAAAFLSTAVIWGMGGSIAINDRRDYTVAQRRNEPYDTGKAKRNAGSLTSVIDNLTPEQMAALEIALQRRRELFDEDDQILANRLSAEMDRSGRAY